MFIVTVWYYVHMLSKVFNCLCTYVKIAIIKHLQILSVQYMYLLLSVILQLEQYVDMTINQTPQQYHTSSPMNSKHGQFYLW